MTSGGIFAFVQLAMDKVVHVVAAAPDAAASVPTTAASAANATSSAGPAATAAAATPVSSLQNFQFTQIHQSPLAAHFPWLTHFFAGTFLVSAIALVILLAVQTTKQEGLGGTIGGRVESSYRPRLGFDEQLQRITTFVAIVFVVFGTVVAISGI